MNPNLDSLDSHDKLHFQLLKLRMKLPKLFSYSRKLEDTHVELKVSISTKMVWAKIAVVVITFSKTKLRVD